MEQHNSTFFYRLKLWLCYLFNQLPLFHISQDEIFDSIENLSDLRFSFIAFPWGDKYLYIASFLFTLKKFEWGKCLRLSDIQPPMELSELNKKVDAFYKLTKKTAEKDSKLRIEFLKHKNEECKSSLNVLNNKVNSYIAVVLVYAGFFAFLVQSSSKYVGSPFPYFNWFLLTLSGLNLVNVLVLLRHYLKVKGSHKSTFGSFKKSPSWKLLAKSLYMDWQTVSYEKTAAASIVINIEKYFIRSIILCALLFVAVEVSPVISLKGGNVLGSKNVNNEFVLLNQNGDFLPQELVKLSKHISLKKEVLFIYPKSNIDGKETAEFIIKALKLVDQYSLVVVSDDYIEGQSLIAIIQDKK